MHEHFLLAPKRCFQPVPSGWGITLGPILWLMTQAFSVWSTLSLLFNVIIAKSCSQSCFTTIYLFFLTLTHRSSFASHSSFRPLSESWVTQPVCHDEFPLLLFFPIPLPPSSSHHQSIPPQWSGGMPGCIPGLMKLILQESRPKWSLNQHHKNKRLLVQVVSHTRLPRHFSVFVQHYKIQSSELWITPFNYAGWEGRTMFLCFVVVKWLFGWNGFPIIT